MLNRSLEVDDSKGVESTQRRSWLARFARSALLIYLLVLLLMLLLENFLIFPAPKYPDGNWQPADLAYEDVYFQSADGTQLHGWFVPHPDPKAYILFCHGNAEHIAYLADQLGFFQRAYRASVFAFDYRGYGRSAGSPDEQGVLSDGRAAHRWLVQRAGIDAKDVVLIGRSLGGAVAVDLASAHGARGLVLERTFTKLPDVAAGHYPFLPVRLVMKTQFDSTSKIQNYHGPLLLSHGTADEIIPFELGKRLFDLAPSAASKKHLYVEQGSGHNDPYSREYLQALGEFLGELPNLNSPQ